MSDCCKNLEQRLQKLEKTVDKLQSIINSKPDKDELFNEAIKTVKRYEEVSASLLQRRLKVGYARAARILDELEEIGIVGPGEGGKPRKVLNPKAK